MSHTLETNGVVFNFNADLSGVVSIAINDKMLDVPGDALLAFIANYVRYERISELEQMDSHEVLGLPRLEPRLL